MSGTEPSQDALAAERHRELAVEHLLFQTLTYVERQHPGLIDHLEAGIDHLGDAAHDDTKNDEAVREIARRFVASLRAQSQKR